MFNRPVEKFLGKPRKAGEVLSEDEFARLDPRTVDGLVSQKILTLDADTASLVGTSSGERVDRLQASVDALRDQVTKLAEAVGALLGAAPVKPRRK